MLKPHKKITRAELRRDPLMEGVYKARQFGSAHRDDLVKYGGGAAVLLILFLFGMNWRSGQNEEARSISGIVAMDFSKQQYSQVISQVSSRMEDYGGLPAFGAAVFFLARAELIVADTLRAEQHFRLYLDDYGDDELLAAGAYSGLGIIADSRGTYGEAGDYYRKAYKIAGTDFMRHSNAVHAGRSYLLANQPGQTLEILQPLLEHEQLNRQIAAEAATIVAQAEIVLGRM